MVKKMKRRLSTKRTQKASEPTCYMPEGMRTSEEIRREYKRLARGLNDAVMALVREEGWGEPWDAIKRDEFD